MRRKQSKGRKIPAAGNRWYGVDIFAALYRNRGQEE